MKALYLLILTLATISQAYAGAGGELTAPTIKRYHALLVKAGWDCTQVTQTRLPANGAIERVTYESTCKDDGKVIELQSVHDEGSLLDSSDLVDSTMALTAGGEAREIATVFISALEGLGYRCRSWGFERGVKPYECTTPADRFEYVWFGYSVSKTALVVR